MPRLSLCHCSQSWVGTPRAVFCEAVGAEGSSWGSVGGGENGLTHTGPEFVVFRFENGILGQICSGGAVNKSESSREGRGEGLEFWGLWVPWDQVREGKAAGRAPALFGKMRWVHRSWEMRFKVPSRIVLGFCGSITSGKHNPRAARM